MRLDLSQAVVVALRNRAKTVRATAEEARDLAAELDRLAIAIEAGADISPSGIIEHLTPGSDLGEADNIRALMRFAMSGKAA